MGVAISADGRSLYTANGPSNDVSIVDAARRTVIGRIPVGEGPWGIAISIFDALTCARALRVGRGMFDLVPPADAHVRDAPYPFLEARSH